MIFFPKKVEVGKFLQLLQHWRIFQWYSAFVTYNLTNSWYSVLMVVNGTHSTGRTLPPPKKSVAWGCVGWFAQFGWTLINLPCTIFPFGTKHPLHPQLALVLRGWDRPANGTVFCDGIPFPRYYWDRNWKKANNQDYFLIYVHINMFLNMKQFLELGTNVHKYSITN